MNRCKAEKQKHSLPIGCCVATLTLYDSHDCGETHYRCIIQEVLTNSLHVPVDVRQPIQTESIFRKCEWARKSRGRRTWQTESIHVFLTSLLAWTQQDDFKCCSWDIKAVALKLLHKPLWVAVISLSERRSEDWTNVFHSPGLTRPQLPGLFRGSPHRHHHSSGVWWRVCSQGDGSLMELSWLFSDQYSLYFWTPNLLVCLHSTFRLNKKHFFKFQGKLWNN